MLESDIETLFEFQNDLSSAWKTGGRWDPRDPQAFREKQLENLAMKPELGAFFVVLEGDTTVGSVGYFTRGNGLELMYWLGPDYRGRGLGTSCVRSLLTLMAERFTGEVCAKVVKGNLGSVRVLEKCGFRLAGEGSFYSPFLDKNMPDQLFVRKLEPRQRKSVFTVNLTVRGQNDGIIFALVDGAPFPGREWADFAFDIVWEWTTQAVEITDGQKVRLHFLDGPEYVEASLSGDIVTLDCIRWRKKRIHTTQIPLQDFRLAILDLCEDLLAQAASLELELDDRFRKDAERLRRLL